MTPSIQKIGSNLSLNFKDNTHFDIYSLDGKAIVSKDYAKGTVNIPLNFAAGEYLVVAKTGEISVIQKIAIAK